MGEPNDSGRDAVEAELEAMLVETEATSARVREELLRRRARRQASEEELAVQHQEVDHLFEHLEESKVHWRELTGFFERALADLFHHRHHSDEPPQDQAAD